MFRMITIEREFGSGGGGIACSAGAPSGLEAVGSATDVREFAKRAQCGTAVALCDERVDGRLYRLAESVLARQ